MTQPLNIYLKPLHQYIQYTELVSGFYIEQRVQILYLENLGNYPWYVKLVQGCQILLHRVTFCLYCKCSNWHGLPHLHWANSIHHKIIFINKKFENNCQII